MSEKYLSILEKQLNRFHDMLDLSDPDSDDHWFALRQIDDIMAILTHKPTSQVDATENLINELLEKAPAPDEVM